jgi:hypothetical protein
MMSEYASIFLQRKDFFSFLGVCKVSLFLNRSAFRRGLMLC